MNIPKQKPITETLTLILNVDNSVLLTYAMILVNVLYSNLHCLSATHTLFHPIAAYKFVYATLLLDSKAHAGTDKAHLFPWKANQQQIQTYGTIMIHSKMYTMECKC